MPHTVCMPHMLMALFSRHSRHATLLLLSVVCLLSSTHTGVLGVSNPLIRTDTNANLVLNAQDKNVSVLANAMMLNGVEMVTMEQVAALLATTSASLNTTFTAQLALLNASFTAQLSTLTAQNQ